MTRLVTRLGLTYKTRIMTYNHNINTMMQNDNIKLQDLCKGL